MKIIFKIIKFVYGAIIYFLYLMLELLAISFLGWVSYNYFLGLSLTDFMGVFISFIITIIVLNLRKFKFHGNLGGIIKFLIGVCFVSIVWEWIWDVEFLNKIYCDGDGNDNSNDNNNNNNNETNTDNNKSSTDSKSSMSIKRGEHNTEAVIPNTVIDRGVAALESLAKSGAAIVPNLGVGSAAGVVGKAVFDGTAALPLTSRIGLAAIGAGATAGSVQFGLESAKAVLKNDSLLSLVKNRDKGSGDSSPPSPSEYDSSNVYCILEDNETVIPLILLLKNLFILNVLEFIIFIILIIFIVYLLIPNKINFVSKFISKYISSAYSSKINKMFESGEKLNRKFTIIMIIILLIALLLIRLMLIFFSYELYYNVEDYVLVYNFFKKSFIIPIGIMKLKKNNFRYLSSDKLTEKMAEREDGLNIYMIIEKYGSYNYYINNINSINVVDDEFIKKNYPEFVGNVEFKEFILELQPIFREEVKFVISLYEVFNKLNENIEFIFKAKEKIGRNLDRNSFASLLKHDVSLREDIMKNYKNVFRDNSDYINNLFKKMNNKIILKNIEEKLMSEDINMKHINNIDEFDSIYFKLDKLLKNDLKGIDDEVENFNFSYDGENIKLYSDKLKELFKSLYMYYEFYFGKVKDTNEGNIWLEKFISKFRNLKNNSRVEHYKTKKKKEKSRRIRPGLIYGEYEMFINDMKKELIENIRGMYKTKEEDNLNVLNKNMININEKIENINLLYDYIVEDKKYLIEELNKVLDLGSLIMNLHFSNSDDLHVEKMVNKIFDVYIKGSDNDTILDIINITKLSNRDKKTISSSIEEKELTKRNSFSVDSIVFVKLNEIMNNDKLKSEVKELLIERFILEYEREFILNLFKKMGKEETNYKFLVRLLKNSDLLEEKLNSLYSNFRIRDFEYYYKNKNKIDKRYFVLILALFIVVDNKLLTNFILSKILTIVSLAISMSQNQLLASFSNEIIKIIKYRIKKIDLDKQSQYNKSQIEIINEAKLLLTDINLSEENKLGLGHILLDFVLDSFDNFFIREKRVIDNQTFIYYSLDANVQDFLFKNSYNPLRLPMVCKPKIWTYESETKDNTSNNNIIIKDIGGYLLDEYNQYNDNALVKENKFNKGNTELSINQIQTINYLNNQEFIINKEMLDFVLNEWNNDNSVIFENCNKPHKLTDSINKLKQKDRIEVFAHNSKYWNYTNIINLAILLKNTSFYFPTFMDFRGRIYPISTYLTYQSNDLARSLLLFKKIELQDEKKINKDVYDITEMKMKDFEKNKLKDLEYVKIYIANTYGKNKLLLKNRIGWVEKNWDDMVNLYEKNKLQFRNKYLNNSKEPFQFMSSFLSLYLHKYKNKDVNIPILFDATCSGIQHLSALSKNIEIGKLVNLFYNEDGEVKDFYNFVIEKVLENIQNMPNSKFRSKLIKLNFIRKWLKSIIMTIPYNSTIMGIVEKLEEQLNEYYYIIEDIFNELECGNITLQEAIKLNKEFNNKLNETYKKNKEVNIIKTEKEKKYNKPKYIHIHIPNKEILKDVSDKELYITSKELFALAEIIESTVLSIIPPFKELNKYFEEIIKILKIYNLPIFWTTPACMRVHMSTPKMSKKLIKTSLLKNSKAISILIPTDQMNYKAMYNGLMPNFIHSLDASNIHLLVQNILKYYNISNINLYTIHDCFASDYKNMHIIEMLVRISFIQLYFNEDYLKKLDLDFINQIGSCTTVYSELITENNLSLRKNYILVDKTKNKDTKIYLPELPDFKWAVNEIKLKGDILNSTYFIT